jgi:peptidoglycan hydrolase-like protein with peptidoglycan-binding domain
MDIPLEVFMQVRVGAIGMFVGLLVAGCTASSSSPVGNEVVASPPAAPSVSPTPTPTPTPTAVVHKVLKPGAKGEDVRVLQRTLASLHYDPGTVDGRYGQGTLWAVWAFEKVNKLKVGGTVGKKVWAALEAPKEPRALTAKREADRVDIDLKRQFLVVYQGGKVALISHISSGGGYEYCAKDIGGTVPRCRYAVTQLGDFQTGRRVTKAWDTGPLGHLYAPVYFNGGIAVHGYPEVPAYPASHGCVRVPLHTMDLFQDVVGTGVPVHVRG